MVYRRTDGPTDTPSYRVAKKRQTNVGTVTVTGKKKDRIRQRPCWVNIVRAHSIILSGKYLYETNVEPIFRVANIKVHIVRPFKVKQMYK